MAKKILLIDDSETVQLMVRMILGRDYDVTSAKDGRTGVARAISERPDLILLDVVMPGIDGVDTLRILRASEATRDTPVMMVTTRGEAETMERSFRGGCTDFVTKPINPVELIAKVQDCLGA